MIITFCYAQVTCIGLLDCFDWEVSAPPLPGLILLQVGEPTPCREIRVSLHSDVIDINLFVKDEVSLPVDDAEVMLAVSHARAKIDCPIPTPILSWSISVSSSKTRCTTCALVVHSLLILDR
ncbi:hypothetical protein ACHAXM_005420 [Skeletonema potamos]